MNTPFRVSLFFLVCALGLFWWSVRVFRAYNWTPVRIPIAFDKVRTYTATFRADKTTRYYITMECDRTGGNMEDDEQRLRKSVATCRVTDGRGKRVNEPGNGGGYGAKIEYTLVTFKAKNRERYTVTIDIAPPDAELSQRNPHLVAAITPVDFKKAYVNTALIQYAALLCGIISVGALLFGIVPLRKG